MDPRAKCRRQLEKAGFAGRNLENAMDLAERSGSPKLLTAALMVLSAALGAALFRKTDILQKED